MPPETHSDNLNDLPRPLVRVALSLLITIYLAIVVLGPLSNPISSENLTAPISQKIAPVHQIMFLGHGYRFFGPDPGPSHIVEYVVEQEGGTEITRQFPDRDQYWPRLLYHRWFMLSETIYEESLGLIDEEQFKQIIFDLDTEIETMRMRNAREIMDELVEQRNKMKSSREFLKTRLGKLLKATATYLLKENDGQKITLYLRERLIPRPADSRSRVKLSDPRYLSERKHIGEFINGQSPLEAIDGE